MLEINVSENVITLTNKFFSLGGKQTPYEGSAKMKIEGDKIITMDHNEIDSNTNNKIENHIFNGYITHNHIYIYEEYVEVMSEDKKEHRRNEVHYYFVDEDQVVNINSVYVKDELFVFGSSHLKRKQSI